MRVAGLALLLAGLVLAAPAAGQGAGGGASEAELDVLALFRELQVAQPNGFPRYEVVETPAGPRAFGGVLYGPRARIAVVLDRPHAYLRLIDRGDGDGADTMVSEAAVWLDAEGAPLLALSEWGARSGRPFGGRLRLYSRASGRWNLVNDSALPAELERRLCGAEPQQVAEDTSAWEGLGAVVALLPREGTDIAAWCVGPGPTHGANLVWNRERAAFELGARREGTPQWLGSDAGAGR